MSITSEKGDFVHEEVVVPEVLAARPVEELHADLLKVDEVKAHELQEELGRSKQAGYAPVTDEEKAANRALNRRLDLFVLPFCTCIYFLNGLDRSNIGNAASGNLTQDLNMPASAINTASTLFFATFIPLQPVVAGIGKRVGQTYFLTFLAFVWGTITLCQAFMKTEAQLIGLRLLIGVFECGTYPTIVSYLTTFYPRFDLAVRISVFYGAYAVAGAFGGLIAFGCFSMTNTALWGWQYLFLIEGALTMGISLIIPFWLPKDPARAWFLTPEQRVFADKRMVIDSASNFESTNRVTRRDAVEAFTDWKLWLILPCNIIASVASQSFGIFFPLIIKGLGYSGALANLMTVPPYVISAIALYIFAYSSDHFHNRIFHILGGLLIVLVGLICAVTIPLGNIAGRYVGFVILLAGTFIPSPLTAAWLAGNTPEPGKRTIVIGINGWGNLSGIIGSELFLAKYGPNYIYPLRVTLGLTCIAMLGYAGAGLALRSMNRYRAKKLAAMTPEEVEEEITGNTRYADKKWTFTYGL